MSSIVLYGRPGSGKSTMAASMTKLGYRVHFLDMDKKVKTMKNLESLLEEGSVTVDECPYKTDEGKWSSRVKMGKDYYPLKQPKGYLWLVDRITELEEDPPEDAYKTVPVIDSATAVNRHLHNLMKHFMKSPKLGFDGWGVTLQNYNDLFQALADLQPDPYPHSILIAHAKDDKDDIIQTIETRPMIDGQSKDTVGSWVEEMYFLYVEAIGKAATPKFMCYTKPVGRITQARSSRVSKTVIESDFSVIFKGEEAKK